MAYDLIIRRARVATASESFVADIGVTEGRVAALGSELVSKGARVIEAEGLLAVPGGIDVHTHLDMPFGGTTTADDFVSGTTAAACGGTTSLVDFAIQKKGGTLTQALDTWHAKAEGKSAVDYGFHMIIVDLTPEREKEMDRLVQEGVSSFKLFMAYPGVFMSDDATIFRALLRTQENGGMICMHAENGGAIDVLIERALAKGQREPKHHALTRPMSAEAEATRRAIALSEMAGAPLYIVHLSAGDAMEEVRRARARGASVHAETCPQYLYLSYEDYERPGYEGAKFVMSPPLRPKGNEERLWRGLSQNWLQVVSTDHCSFCMQGTAIKPGKELGKKDFSKIPNGAPGIETRMMLLYDAVARGRLDLNRFVDITSTAPAKLFGLYPRKGSLAPGADADIVLIDPEGKYEVACKNLHMNADYTPYEGMALKGRIRDVFVRGKQVLTGGKFTGSTSHGRFLKRGELHEARGN